MDELPRVEGPAAQMVPLPSGVSPSGRQSPPDAALRSPVTSWPWWTAPLALIGGLVLATLGGLIVAVAALVLGARISSSYTPPGVTIAGTFVQDVGFVLASVYCAHIGRRAVHAWQFGLRRPSMGWRKAGLMVFVLLLAFLVFSVAWSEAFNPGREKVLEQLGANEGRALLLLSAGLTCVVAPICEEFLFRGFIFTALRNWWGTFRAALVTGLVFGGVHALSAPALDLVPLAALGFGLCLLYRYTGSLYPGIVAHSLNNSLAFSALESWKLLEWRTLALTIGSLLAIGALVLTARRVGLIDSDVSLVGSDA
jgi:membrane protease YdiL (CAAX protease family)